MYVYIYVYMYVYIYVYIYIYIFPHYHQLFGSNMVQQQQQELLDLIKLLTGSFLCLSISNVSIFNCCNTSHTIAIPHILSSVL